MNFQRFLLVLCLSVFVTAELSSDVLLHLEAIQYPNAILPISESNLSLISQPNRNHFTLLVLTSTDERHGCADCNRLKGLLNRLSESWYSNYPDSTYLLFAEVDIIDPFSIFEKPSPSKPALNTVSQTQKPQQTTVKVAPHARHQQPEISLLDDEFTDVFETQSVASAPVSTNTREDTSLPHPTLPPRPKENTAEDSRDEVLAGLVDIGFSLSVSNQAIDAVGADLQACVNHIMSNGNRQDPTSGRGDSRTPPDLSATLQDFSTDLFKRATKLLDKSKRTVIKNINQFHANQGKNGSDGLPAWMIEQDKYKESASERKKGGGVYEDYGDDRENINKDDIQRIMRAQRQREKERQRERLERNGRGS